MKFWISSLLLAFGWLCLPVLADTDIGNKGAPTDDEAIGSVPRTTKVPAGHCHNNGDVGVCTDPGSGGVVRMSPKTGTSGSSTDVTSQSGWTGDVDGVDSNDAVQLGHSNTASVSGNGGTVNVSSSSTVTVTNNGGAGANITVNHPGGPTNVGSGQTQTFNT